MSKQKIGLVMEGGSMRGLYSAGVVDVLLEENIPADVVIGVSAGAIHGCNYVSRQIGRSIEYYEKYRNDKHFMGLYSFLTTGDVVGKEFCYNEIPTKLYPFDDETFEHSPVEFYVTMTNVETGKPEYVRCPNLRLGEYMDVIRAGASMPLVSKAVQWRGNTYLDGGISDSIPLAKAKELGCEKCICVLTQPAGYVKGHASTKPYELRYPQWPKLAEAMGRRDRMYNQQVLDVEQAERRGEVVLIRPSKQMNVGRMEKDVKKLRELYELGRADTLAKLAELKAFTAGTRDSDEL